MAKYTFHLDALAGSIFRELRRQTDRGAGVLGGALVDESLRAALTCLWRNDGSKKTIDVRNEIIPDSGGPLTFGIQIGLAYLTGLVGPSVHGELKAVNKIRNKFAHRTEIADSQRVPAKVSFETDAIRSLGEKFVAVDHVPLIYNKKRLPVKKPRHRFLATCMIIHSALTLYTENPTKHDKVIDGFLKS